MSERVLPILDEKGNFIPAASVLLCGIMAFPDDLVSARSYHQTELFFIRHMEDVMGDVQIDDIEIPEAYEHLSKLVDRKLKAGLTAGAMCLDICVQATAGGKPSLNKARHFLSGLASLSRERNPKLATIEKNEENNGKYERQYRDVSHFWAAIIYQALTTQDEWTWNDFWLDMVEDREKFLEFLAISHSIYLDFASALSNEIRAPWVVPSDLDLPKAVVTYQINDFREEYLRNYKSLTARGY